MPRQSSVTSRKIDAKPHKIGKKPPAPSGNSKSDEESRFNMISEAAYYRALGRGFGGGDPVEDWLMAEEEIDAIPHDWDDPDSHRETVD